MKKLAAALIYIVLTNTTAWGLDGLEFYNLGIKSQTANKKIAYFSHAIQVNPDLTEAYERRGLHYYFQRRFDKAIRDYGRVIEDRPQNADAFLMRGSAYLKKEKGGGYRTEFENLALHYRLIQPGTNDTLDRAIRDLSRAVELNPELAAAFGYRAEAYRLKGLDESALRDATIAIRLGNDSKTAARAFTTRSKVYGKQGRNDLAEMNYKKSIELYPYSPDFPPLNVPIMFHDTYDTANLNSMRRLGVLGIIVLAFVVIFKLAIPTPDKDKFE